MSNNETGGETTPGLEDILVQNRYCCTECKSFIEILLLDENNNEIEFRCLNPENFHRKKMKIKEYFCFDCNQNLCNECLETRNHIFHKKIFITEMALTEKEKEVISDIINHYKKEKEELN